MESREYARVLRLAAPAAMSSLAGTMMSLVDTAMVGHLGTGALAAVGLGNTLAFTFLSPGLGALQVVGAEASRRVGARDEAGAARALWHGVYFAVAAGLLTALCAIAASLALPAAGLPEEVAALAGPYVRAVAWMAIPWFINQACVGFLNGHGDTRTPLLVTLGANVINAAGNAALMYHLGWGVVGSAAATVAAHTASTAVYGLVLLRRHRLRPIALDAGFLRAQAEQAGPLALHYLLDVSAFLLFGLIVGWAGERALAANQVTMRLISLSFMMGHGISAAATTLVGQAVGAGDLARARADALRALWVGVALMGGAGVGLALGGGPLAALFTPDAEVRRTVATLLWVAAAFQVFDAAAMVVHGVLKAVADARWAMWAGIAGAWLVGVPATLLLSRSAGLGVYGAWLGLTAQIVAVGSAYAWRLTRAGVIERAARPRGPAAEMEAALG